MANSVEPPDAPAAALPLRGFCHQCEREVIPRALDEDESFECPHCQESCVECPYTSYEMWEGVWQVRLANGRSHRLTVDAEGAATILGQQPSTATGAAPLEASLVWAPTEHEGFLMRLDGPALRAAGVREHLGLDMESSGSLRVRYESADGVVLGSARRGNASGAVVGNWMEAMDALMGTIEDLEHDGGGGEAEGPMAVDADRGVAAGAPGAPGAAGAAGPEPAQVARVQRALDRGLEQMAANWPGLGGADRDEMRRQLQQFTAPLAGILAQNGPLVASLGAPQAGGAGAPAGAAGHPGGPGVIFAPIGLPGGQLPGLQGLFGGMGMLDPTLAAAFGLGPPWQMGAGGGTNTEHAGAPEADVASWLENRGIDAALAAGQLEPEWQCPICFDSSLKDLVAVCRDDAGRTVHAFHKECVANWLVRRSECPSCRRTPVVLTPAPSAATGGSVDSPSPH
mmetsp:Transcript_5644/g.15416  ORF Transcript_5644/g.15416 Transcript_5644/m.15416 type:complete len:455 (+) Transcript_5644:128-1492(+)